MPLRRSQLEAEKRFTDREALAKHVAVALPRTTFSARIMGNEVVDASKRVAAVKREVSGPEQTLMRQAVHFCSAHFRDNRMNNIGIAPGSIAILEGSVGSRTASIKTASIKLKASIRVADGQTVSEKPFDVNMTYASGQFTVDSLEVGDSVLPVQRQALKRIAEFKLFEKKDKADEDDKGEKADGDKKEASCSGKSGCPGKKK